MKTRISKIIGSLAVLAGSFQVLAQEVTRVGKIQPFAVSGSVSSGSTSQTGEVSIKKSAGKKPADLIRLGAAIGGEKISTGADGSASLALGDGADIGTGRLDVNSEIKVPDDIEKSQSLELLRGKLFLNISAEQLKQRDKGVFKLKTPAALLAVKGTKFFAFTQDGKDILGVHEGSASVQAGGLGRQTYFGAGEAVEISNDAMAKPRPLTQEERELAKVYDLANLAAINVESLIKGQQPSAESSAFMRWAVFKGYDLNFANSQPHMTGSFAPTSTKGGEVAYFFTPPAPNQNRPYFEGYADFSWQGSSRELEQAPPVSLAFVVTASPGIRSADFSWMKAANNSVTVRFGDAQAQTKTVVIPISTASKVPELKLHVEIHPNNVKSKQQGLECRIEMSDFRFLTLPP
ncbi:MAG: FecR family protein [Verrucomicrobiaceae bacterium]